MLGDAEILLLNGDMPNVGGDAALGAAAGTGSGGSSSQSQWDVNELMRRQHAGTNEERHLSMLVEVIKNPLEKKEDRMRNIVTLRGYAMKVRTPLQDEMLVKAFTHIMQHDLWVVPTVRENVLWAITNMACENSFIVHYMLSQNVLENILEVFSDAESTPDVLNQAVWALSNIAADCHRCRLRIRDTSFIQVVVNKFISATAKQEIGLCLWTIRNLLRPVPLKMANGCSFITNKPDLFKVIAHHAVSSDNDEFVKECLSAITDWVEADSDACRLVMLDATLVRYLIQHISGPCDDKTSMSTRIVGTLACDSDHYINALLEMNVLPALESRLAISTNSLQREICWTLSNIVALRDLRLIEQMLDHESTFNLLLNLCYDLEPSLRCEALFCVYNLVSLLPDSAFAYYLEAAFGEIICDTIYGFADREEDEEFFPIISVIIAMIAERLIMRSDVIVDFVTNSRISECLHRRIERCQDFARIKKTRRAKAFVLMKKCNTLLQLIDNAIDCSEGEDMEW